MDEIKDRESLCIKVSKTQGEKMLELIQEIGIANRKLRIQNDASSIYIPLSRQPNEKENAAMRVQSLGFVLETRTFYEKSTNKTLKSVLDKQLQPSLLASLPRALDIIGDIAIIEIPSELRQQERRIGKAILESHRSVQTVLAKAGAVSGTHRLREFTLIAGEQKTNTLHKEYGCTYMVDVAKAYFSPRLSQEHKRVASLVQSGETIVDLFAGIGPFSILIARARIDVKVYSVDINPEAIRLLETNARLNRVENRVFPILGDATKIVEGKLAGIADRVIMNLPERATKFVEAACRAIKPPGGIVHFYSFVRRPETIEELQRQFCERVEETGRKVDKFLSVKVIRETAPYEWQVALDARII